MPHVIGAVWRMLRFTLFCLIVKRNDFRSNNRVLNVYKLLYVNILSVDYIFMEQINAVIYTYSCLYSVCARFSAFISSVNGDRDEKKIVFFKSD